MMDKSMYWVIGTRHLEGKAKYLNSAAGQEHQQGASYDDMSFFCLATNKGVINIFEGKIRGIWRKPPLHLWLEKSLVNLWVPLMPLSIVHDCSIVWQRQFSIHPVVESAVGKFLFFLKKKVSMEIVVLPRYHPDMSGYALGLIYHWHPRGQLQHADCFYPTLSRAVHFALCSCFSQTCFHFWGCLPRVGLGTHTQAIRSPVPFRGRTGTVCDSLWSWKSGINII